MRDFLMGSENSYFERISSLSFANMSLMQSALETNFCYNAMIKQQKDLKAGRPAL